MSKKTKEPPRRANHKGNIKFLNPLLLQEPFPVTRSISNRERGGPPERRPSLEELSLVTIPCLKIETTYTRIVTIDILHL
jgi:hypothetical protein